MKRLAKIATVLMLAVLAWAIVAAALHREPSRADAERSSPSSPSEFQDPLARYREPFRVFRELSQSPTATSRGTAGWLAQASTNGNPLDHAQHPKASPVPSIQHHATSAELDRDADGALLLTWEALAATHVRTDGRADFPGALSAADGRKVRLVGYMTPLDDHGVMDVFLLLGSPVTCFYCQSPGPTGIVAVSVDGPGIRMVHQPVVTEGVLRLNRSDPEDFLFAIESATCRIAFR